MECEYNFDFEYGEEDIELESDIDSDSGDEPEDPIILRLQKRYIRDQNDPFQFYSDKGFKRRYRFEKNNVRYGVLLFLEEHLGKANHRGLPIAPVLQLFVCLRFYATGCFQVIIIEMVDQLSDLNYNKIVHQFQLVDADLFGISQSTVSRIVLRVSLGLARLINEKIKMPTTDHAKATNRRRFNALGFGDGAIGIPGVDGAIDCTHVRLSNCRFGNLAEIFRNRKGYFSLNVQVGIPWIGIPTYVGIPTCTLVLTNLNVGSCRPCNGIPGHCSRINWKHSRQQNFPEFKNSYEVS